MITPKELTEKETSVSKKNVFYALWYFVGNTESPVSNSWLLSQGNTGGRKQDTKESMLIRISVYTEKLVIILIYLNKQLETWDQNQLITLSVMMCASENTIKMLFLMLESINIFVRFSFYCHFIDLVFKAKTSKFWISGAWDRVVELMIVWHTGTGQNIPLCCLLEGSCCAVYRSAVRPIGTGSGKVPPEVEVQHSALTDLYIPQGGRKL